MTGWWSGRYFSKWKFYCQHTNGLWRDAIYRHFPVAAELKVCQFEVSYISATANVLGGLILHFGASFWYKSQDTLAEVLPDRRKSHLGLHTVLGVLIHEVGHVYFLLNPTVPPTLPSLHIYCRGQEV